MFIAVFSDSHDSLVNIEKAVAICKERGITRGLHLGDFCAPPAAEAIAKSGMRFECVWGNVDGDKLASYKRVQPYGTMDFADGDFREVDLDGKKVFITHYPEIARIAALSGEYAAAFHGHNHQASVDTVTSADGKDVLLANPGELAGFRFGKPSFGIYDTESGAFEHIWL